MSDKLQESLTMLIEKSLRDVETRAEPPASEHYINSAIGRFTIIDSLPIENNLYTAREPYPEASTKSIEQIIRESLEAIKEIHGLLVTNIDCRWYRVKSDPDVVASNIKIDGRTYGDAGGKR